MTISAENDTKRAAKQVMTFFLFILEITPIVGGAAPNCNLYEAGPLPQKKGLELNLSVPILIKKNDKPIYLVS